MSHKQKTNSLVLTLLCCINIQMSASQAENPFPTFIRVLDTLIAKQSLASRTKNLEAPCIQNACEVCLLGLPTAITLYCFYPSADLCSHRKSHAITIGYCAGKSYYICAQECFVKPKIARQAQEELTALILQKYSVDTIQQAVPREHPLWLAAQNYQKMQ